MSGDDEIGDDEVLLRRALARDLKPDGVNSSLWRSAELSVHRASLTSIEKIAAANPECVRIYSITAGGTSCGDGRRCAA